MLEGMEGTGLFPHLFWFPTKAVYPVDFVKGAEEATEKKSLPASTRFFFESLAERRDALLGSLSAAGGSAEEVDTALGAYFSRLNILLLPAPESKKGKDADQKLEGLWTFKWGSVLGGGVVAANDVRFEVASMLVNVALWKAKKASELTVGDAQITQVILWESCLLWVYMQWGWNV